MEIKCYMCNNELAIEDICLCGDKCLVRVWPCEQCQQEIGDLREQIELYILEKMNDG
jgi:hypothetical protein